jgi:nicotinate-nucleotide adenylyltransferase
VRLGLLGGTFDPPHTGHLLAASDAFELLELDRLVFVPAAQQPLKAGSPVAPPEIRLRLLELLVEGDSRFEVDPLEIRRSGLSFTVDTLEEYARRYPRAERYFLMGYDAFSTLETWREPGRVASLARLVVMTRADSATVSTAGGAKGAVGVGSAGAPRVAEVWERVRAQAASDAPEPLVLATRRIDVSSTEVRERARLGRPIRGFVPDAVARFIETNGLYR